MPVTSDTGELAVRAADRIFREGLRSGGSTFEPGLPAWSATAVAELRRCFVEKPDQGGDDFLTKLQRQLSDAPDEAIVLAAELLYLNMLPLHERQIGRPAKRHILTTVLSWVKTGSPEVPQDLDDAMAGFINGGMAFLSLRWAQLQFLILLVGELLQADPSARESLLTLPSAFQQLCSLVTVHHADGLHCVVDAKYKTTDGYPSSPADLYQLTAYCTALGLKTGHLVYANGPAEPVTHEVGPTGTTIIVHGLNLAAAPAEILETLASIAEITSRAHA